ncbi:NACHT and WD repeat domain-containing protein 2-like [Lingula anatina]|uniref:NACHT and WD repeat domain-containing protein 2-like n=1 Tax=Lingula anatina TaxID=7574 RepID=A0A1S3IB29_LINAN|nr:NACHT and WD repeat domain-containing protein 2-like [Lingula anatina]|eukprot:XP_013395467.1 NACHT and WD repeat domain-containing protein 2-like [Lingula anatina]
MLTDHEEDVITKTLEGQLVDLPSQSSGAVKIFICCTQSDFQLERCILWEIVLPELQQYCSQHGLDVELVDPLHGTYVDPSYDRSLFDLCMLELEDCHRISQGPFFLCLTGNKYGPTPLPAYIKAEDFDIISAKACEAGKDMCLLNSWYIKDDVLRPTVYRLKDPREKLKYYDCRNPEMQGLRERDQLDWLETFKELQEILQTSLEVASAEGPQSKDLSEYYTGGK